MSWRDNPSIVWQDEDGDRIELADGFLAVVETDRCMGHESGIDSVYAPVSLADRIEATERWLAAAGLTADNIRELPRPIEVGDIVEWEWSIQPFEVRHIDGDMALVRLVSEGARMVAPIESLTRVDPEAVCKGDHSLCVDGEGDWCGDESPDVELVCSRLPGHDGPHVACDPSGYDDDHGLASWGGDL